MKESNYKLEDNFILSDASFYTTNDLLTNIGYSEQEDRFVLIKKYPHKLKIGKNIIMHSEINKQDCIIKLDQAINEQSLVTVHEMEDFMPLKLFIEEYVDNFDYLYQLMGKLISLEQDSAFFRKISEFLDVDTIWITKDFDIKICWVTFLVKYERYFDNTIYKTNVKTIDGVFNLFNYNKKRLQKRPSKNLSIDSSKTIQDASENFFKFNYSPKINPLGTIQYEDKVTSIDKGSVRVCGTKKLCIENIKGFCKSIEDKRHNFRGVRLILLKILFKNEDVNQMNVDIYISRLKEIYKTKSNHLFNLTDNMDEVIEFIIDNNIDKPPNMEKIPNSKPNEVVVEFVKNQKKVLKNENNLSSNETEPLENIFEEKGFNMSEFNTKSYKKGRFYVCQAIPNSIKSQKSEVDLNKIFQIIEIQNRQIEMMYQTLKERNNIDQVIDAQLESLSLQANEMLTDLDKNEE